MGATTMRLGNRTLRKSMGSNSFAAIPISLVLPTLSY